MANDQARGVATLLEMTDPVAEVVSLLKPNPSISKLVTGGGEWLVERTELGNPFYCAVVEGRADPAPAPGGAAARPDEY